MRGRQGRSIFTPLGIGVLIWKTFRVRLSAPAAMMAQQPGLVAFLYVDGQHATGSFWARTDPSVHLSKMYMNEGGKQYSADLTFTTLVSSASTGRMRCRLTFTAKDRRGVAGPSSGPGVEEIVQDGGSNQTRRPREFQTLRSARYQGDGQSAREAIKVSCLGPRSLA